MICCRAYRSAIWLTVSPAGGFTRFSGEFLFQAK